LGRINQVSAHESQGKEKITKQPRALDKRSDRKPKPGPIGVPGVVIRNDVTWIVRRGQLINTNGGKRGGRGNSRIGPGLFFYSKKKNR